VDGRNPAPPGMYKNPVNNGIFYHINWCRSSSINSIKKPLPFFEKAPVTYTGQLLPIFRGEVLNSQGFFHD